MSETQSGTADPVETQRRILALLDKVARSTGDARYRIAAGIVAGRRIGRPARDDAAALGMMRDMLDAGFAATAEQAARFVARALQGEHSIPAAVKRLAVKYRASAAEKTT